MFLSYFQLYIIFINLVTAFLFYYDKKKAISGGRRISEFKLHLCEFLGGIFFSIPMMLIMRHKTKKWSFKFYTFFILIIWILILIFVDF